MDLQIEHGRPDEEGRDHLDGREPPVREEQFDPLEKHGERTDQQGQWCEDPTALAEGDDRGLYRVVVFLSYCRHQVLDVTNDAHPRVTRMTSAPSAMLTFSGSTPWVIFQRLLRCERPEPRSLEPPASNAHLSVDLAIGDGRNESLMVTLILVGIGGREAGDRIVEARARAKVGGDCQPVAGSGVGTG